MVFNHLKKMHSFLSNEKKEMLQKDSDLDSLLDGVPDKSSGNPAEVKPVKTKTSKPKASKPVETKPVETKPVKPKTSKPKASKPVETKPVETKPPETKPAAVATPSAASPALDPNESNFQEMFGNQAVATPAATVPATNASQQQAPAPSAQKAPAEKTKTKKVSSKKPAVEKLVDKKTSTPENMPATGGFKEDALAQKPASVAPSAQSSKQPMSMKINPSTYGFTIQSGKMPGSFQMPQKRPPVAQKQPVQFSPKGESALRAENAPVFLPTNMRERLGPEALERWKQTFKTKIENHPNLTPEDKKMIINRLHELYGKPKENQPSIKDKFKNFLQGWRSKTKESGAVNKSLLAKADSTDDDLMNLLGTLDDTPQKQEQPKPDAASQVAEPKRVIIAPKKPVMAGKKPEQPASPTGIKSKYELNHPKYMVQHLIQRTKKVTGKDTPSTRKLALKGARSSLVKFAQDFPEHTQDLINKLNQFVQSDSEQKPETPDTHEVISELQGMLQTAKSKNIEQKPLENFKPEVYSRIKDEEERIKKETQNKNIQKQNSPGQGFSDLRWTNAVSRMGATGDEGSYGTTSTELTDVDNNEDKDQNRTRKEMANFFGLHDKSGAAKVAADILMESFGINRAASEAKNSTETNLSGLKTGAQRGEDETPKKPKISRFTTPEAPNLFTSAETITRPSEVPPAPGSTRKFKDVVNIPSQHYRQYMGQDKISSSDQDWRSVRARHMQLKNQLQQGLEESQDNSNKVNEEKK